MGTRFLSLPILRHSKLFKHFKMDLGKYLTGVNPDAQYDGGMAKLTISDTTVEAKTPTSIHINGGTGDSCPRSPELEDRGRRSLAPSPGDSEPTVDGMLHDALEGNTIQSSERTGDSTSSDYSSFLENKYVTSIPTPEHTKTSDQAPLSDYDAAAAKVAADLEKMALDEQDRVSEGALMRLGILADSTPQERESGHVHQYILRLRRLWTEDFNRHDKRKRSIESEDLGQRKKARLD